MAKAKRVEEKQQQRVVTPSSVTKAAAPSQAALLWKEEVSALSAERFATFEEAVGVVADRVVRRLSGGATPAAAELQFVKDMIATDPTLEATLRKSLRVG